MKKRREDEIPMQNGRDTGIESSRELRAYRRAVRLRRERRKKLFQACAALSAAVFMVLIGSVSYHSIRSSANSGYKYYMCLTVESGDTLWEIADRYIDYDFYKSRSSYIAEVKQMNHLEGDAITEGQRLLIPYYAEEFRY